MKMRPWMPGTALALVAAMLLPFLAANAPIRGVLLGLAGLGILGAVVGALSQKAKRDPYDLSALREVDEREQIRGLLEEEPIADADEVVCRNCGNAYREGLPACPRCRFPNGV